jgi:hypothetical protein
VEAERDVSSRRSEPAASQRMSIPFTSVIASHDHVKQCHATQIRRFRSIGEEWGGVPKRHSKLGCSGVEFPEPRFGVVEAGAGKKKGTPESGPT